MHEVVGWEWALALLGAVVIGLSKTGLPGVGILAIPLFAAIIPARLSTGVVLPMLILADIVAVSVYRRHAVWGHVWRLFPWTMLGLVAGYLLMGRIDDRQLQPVIGVIVLVMLGLNHWRQSRADADTRVPHHPAFVALIGVAAGMTTMLANAAGPIMIIYLLAIGLPKVEFIGTGAWYFFLINVIKIPFSAHLSLIQPDTLRLNLALAPAIIGGALLGFVLAKRIPEKPFTIAVQAMAVLGALRLLWIW